MGSASALCGRSVLVVEDEPLIAVDLMCELETFGAEVSSANSVRATLSLLKRQRFAAVVLDFRLSDGCTHEVRSQLEKLSIPYLIYTGYDEICMAWPEVMVLSKPVAMHVLIETIADLLPRPPVYS